MFTDTTPPENVSNLLKNGRTGSIKRKAPPPPVPRKPSISDNSKPAVPTRPKTNKFIQDNLALSKNSIACNESKKFITPVAERVKYKAPQVSKDNGNIKNELESIFANKQNKNPVTSQLECIFSKPKLETTTFYDSKYNEIPKSEKTISLTEVSSIPFPFKERSADDTLDFTLSDGDFDTSPCHEFVADEISELQVSDDDDFFNSLSLIPPPPPETDLIDDENIRKETQVFY